VFISIISKLEVGRIKLEMCECVMCRTASSQLSVCVIINWVEQLELS